MRHAPGVGLAAPQLGEAQQACVVEVEGRLYELVNPRIVRSTATIATSRAACRSPATSPTSPDARRSGSSPRTATARSTRSPARAPRPRPPARARPSRRQAVHRLPRLDGRADRRRQRRGRRGGRGHPRGPGRARLSRAPTPVSADRRAGPDRLLRQRSFAVPILDALVAAPGGRASSAVVSAPGPAGRRRGARRAPRPWPPAPASSGCPAPPSRLRDPERRSSAIAATCGPIWASSPTTAGSCRQALLDLPRAGSSTSIRRSCRATAAPRRSRRRSWPATRRPGSAVIRMDAGLDTGPIVAASRLAARSGRRPRRSSRRGRPAGGADLVRALARPAGSPVRCRPDRRTRRRRR